MEKDVNLLEELKNLNDLENNLSSSNKKQGSNA